MRIENVFDKNDAIVQVIAESLAATYSTTVDAVLADLTNGDSLEQAFTAFLNELNAYGY